MGAYYPEFLVAELTRQVVQSGETLLQIFRLAEGEAEHAVLLSAEMNFSPGDRIIDAGCGTGALASYLFRIEPTLDLHLLNMSAAQLGYSAPRFTRAVGDIESMPYADGVADGLIFSYVLGHTDIALAMREAGRVLRRGGWMFVYDIAAYGPLHDASAALRYQIRTPAEVMAAAQAAGFTCTASRRPSSQFVSRTVLDSFPDSMDLVFQNVGPLVARFERFLEPLALR